MAKGEKKSEIIFTSYNNNQQRESRDFFFCDTKQQDKTDQPMSRHVNIVISITKAK